MAGMVVVWIVAGAALGSAVAWVADRPRGPRLAGPVVVALAAAAVYGMSTGDGWGSPWSVVAMTALTALLLTSGGLMLAA